MNNKYINEMNDKYINGLIEYYQKKLDYVDGLLKKEPIGDLAHTRYYEGELDVLRAIVGDLLRMKCAPWKLRSHQNDDRRQYEDEVLLYSIIQKRLQEEMK